jgi:hypothetical protein
MPSFKKGHCSISQRGHFYFGQLGHYHFGITEFFHKVSQKERTVLLIDRSFNNGPNLFEIMGSLGPLRGNNDPLLCGAILSQLRHNHFLFDCGVRIVECGISYQKFEKSEIRNPNSELGRPYPKAQSNPTTAPKGAEI